MPQLLSLSRAARLADVTRGELQKKIRKERVKTFEGEIAIEDLLTLYPHINLDDDPVLERVQRIKSEARPKSHYSDGWMPDPQVLMKRLHEFQHTLVQTKSALNTSETLLDDAVADLRSALEKPEMALRAAIKQCIGKLDSARGRLDRASDAKARLFAKDALLKIVTANVRLVPSGHEYFIEGNDSILEAGLKAGLYLDYGCTSGNCGACKCKVVSGAVRKLRPHDYVLSAKEQAEGYILACSNTAISDLVIEANEAHVTDELPHQVIRAVVRKVEQESPGLAVLHVQTPRTQSLRFKAGQRVRVTTEAGIGDTLYIASCPCDGRNLIFLVFSAIGSPLEESVFNGDLSKQTVVIEGPEGQFLLHEDSRRPVLFVAKGGGLAPVKSLVEQAITIDDAEDISLLLVGGSPPGSSLERLCRSWDDALDNFQYRSTEAAIPADQLADQIIQAVEENPRIEVYIAGPDTWMKGLLQAAADKGVRTGEWTVETVGI
ncbi:2Fe-2S iron-sulfur cluster-binding protein [Sedimenticola sp.]|uniref:2Fe-2S iron-sulfur cluster-binding protein n=1 Tax=Sedimenticola sp. TaxID=1940285 RepID=UPI003D0E4AF4